ncbi:MAG: hypothetical protein VX475_22425, partial [Myxococcota bacterium]|nr:hypothetical protein [Myxococcota bacterium]
MTSSSTYKLLALVICSLLLTACKSGGEHTADASEASQTSEQEPAEQKTPSAEAPETTPATSPPAKPMVRE